MNSYGNYTGTNQAQLDILPKNHEVRERIIDDTTAVQKESIVNPGTIQAANQSKATFTNMANNPKVTSVNGNARI